MFMNAPFLSVIHNCGAAKVELPPVTSYELSVRSNVTHRARRRVCVRLLFSECFHRVGGCVGGSRGGGVSSEVGIPEQKNTQQKKGLPPFPAVTRKQQRARRLHDVRVFTGFFDLGGEAVDRVGPRVCCSESAIECQLAVFFFFLFLPDFRDNSMAR